jgi:hypothetical protein
MKRRTELLPKRILEIQKEFVEDLKLNDFNIHEKSMECAGIKGKYLSILFEEDAYLTKLQNTEELLIEQYVEKYGARGVPKFKAENESRNDEDIAKIQKAIKNQKEVCRFIDGLYKIVSAFGFEIKNAAEILKLEK